MGERKTEKKRTNSKKRKKKAWLPSDGLEELELPKGWSLIPQPPSSAQRDKSPGIRAFGSIGICCTAATSGASLWTEYWVDADVRRVKKGSD